MKKEVQIALLAIVTLALSFWGFKFLGGNNLFSGDKIYYAMFKNVKDVNTATPVLINGYQVGTVISLMPEKENIANIKVGFQVKKDIKIPKDAIVELRSSSPLGGRELELVFVKMCDGDDCAPAKTVLRGKTLGLVGSLITPSELDPHLDSFSQTFNETLGRLGNADSEAPIDKAILNLSKTMESLAISTAKFEQLMDRSSRNMEKTMENMASLSSSLIESNEKLGSILENVDVITT
ncbi:MAG: MCE family protein, partial [Saprospiraceae bacterium]|nr:MCE family protein [Saprospiraceae bacterium]